MSDGLAFSSAPANFVRTFLSCFSSLRFDRFSHFFPEFATRFCLLLKRNSENLTLKRENDNRIHLKPSANENFASKAHLMLQATQ